MAVKRGARKYCWLYTVSALPVLLALVSFVIRVSQRHSVIDVKLLERQLSHVFCCQPSAVHQLMSAVSFVQAQPGPVLCVLVLRGPSGSGKTHLATQLSRQWGRIAPNFVWRRLVGPGDPRLWAMDLMSDLVRGSWLLLLLEEITPDAVLQLLRLIEPSFTAVDVKVLLIFCETETPYAQPSRSSLSDHSLSGVRSERTMLVQFRAMTPDDVLQCVALHSKLWRLAVTTEQLQQLVSLLPLKDGAVVNGCKPAISQLLTLTTMQ